MTVTYTHARDHLAEVIDETLDSRDPITITRRGKEDVAVIPAAELRALQETAYLLRSPANAARLHAALTRSRAGESQTLTLEEVAREVGLG